MIITFIHLTPTGLFPQENNPITWPSVSQIAWIITDYQGQVICEEVHHFEKPGDPDPAYVYKELRKQLALTQLIVGHDLERQIPWLRAEMIRHELGTYFPIKPSFCTRAAGTLICRIPAETGYQPPDLDTLFQILCGTLIRFAYPSQDAWAQVLALSDCYREMVRNGLTSPGLPNRLSEISQ